MRWKLAGLRFLDSALVLRVAWREVPASTRQLAYSRGRLHGMAQQEPLHPRLPHLRFRGAYLVNHRNSLRESSCGSALKTLSPSEKFMANNIYPPFLVMHSGESWLSIQV